MTHLSHIPDLGVANGIATLDGVARVVQNPATATLTPTAAGIPIADGAGKIAVGWLPQATETAIGAAEIATQAEVNAGTDDTRFITPLKLKTFPLVIPHFTVATTGVITTTSLTDILVDGGIPLTLTPGAGTYFVHWGMTASHNKTGQTVIGSIYANGVMAVGTERQVVGLPNNLGNMSASCIVTVAAGQTIEARWRISSNSGGGEGYTPGPRSLSVIRLAP